MDQTEFREKSMLKLQGKDYLPVASRVVLFRQEHPDWIIKTAPLEIGEETYMRAEILQRCADGMSGLTIATAHKRVRKDAKGPAGMWPLESAETGAIGRALALCGYGTLDGDLDEGEELADAPVERKGKKKATATPSDWVTKLDAVKTAEEFAAIYGETKAFLDGLPTGSELYKQVYQAGIRAKNRTSENTPR